MNTTKVLIQLASDDIDRVLQAAYEIIDNSQERENIKPLIEYLDFIIDKTKKLEFKGSYYGNKKYLNKVIEIIRFYKAPTGCSCKLYVEGDHNGFNLKKEIAKKNVHIIKEFKEDWVYDYIVECHKCQQEYSVHQNDANGTWWRWRKRTTKYVI